MAARITTAILLLVGALVPLTGGPRAVAATPEAPAAAASSPPATPATGHFHVLPAPKRVVSTLTGTGTAKRPLAKGSAKSLAIGGHAGVPSSNVRAVAVTLTAASPTGATQLWAAPGTTKPSVPSVATSGGTASAFAIVPLSGTGKIHVWNGAHATDLTVDVTGWFSGRSETGRAGLFNRLAGRQLKATTIAAGASKALTVRGIQDVPAGGTDAVLLRTRATGARAPGRLSVAPSKTAAKAVTSLAYATGASSDLVATNLAGNGTVVVRNAGSKAVTVTLDAVGWFSNGSDSSQFGDTLRVAPAANVLRAASVGTTGVVAAVSGVHGVPAETSTSPPSVVLLRSLVTAPTRSAVLRVDAQGATPSLLPVLQYRASAPAAGLVLAQPGTTGNSRFTTSGGTGKVSAESFAWFAGGVVMADTAELLTGTALAAVDPAGTDSDTVTFDGQPAALDDLAVGDVLGAGISADTPEGLLRKVESIDRSGPDLVVETSPGALSDVVVQGTLAVGSGHAPSKADMEALAKGAALGQPATAAHVAHAADVGVPLALPCSDPLGNILNGSLQLACAVTLQEPGVASVTLGAAVGVTASMDVSIGWGVPPDVHASASAEATGAGFLQIHGDGSGVINESYDFPEIRGAPIDVQLGPWPVIVVPVFAASLDLEAGVDVTFDAQVDGSASLGASCDTDSGCATTHSLGGSGSGSYDADPDVHGQITFSPTAKALLYGVAGVTVSIAPYVRAEADSCVMQFTSGADLVLGIEAEAFGHTLIDESVSIPLVKFDLGQIVLRNCAVWSGTFNFSSNLAYTATDYSRDGSSSSNMSIDPVTKPPTYDLYTISGNGSGRSDAHGVISCGTGEAFVEKAPTEMLYTWGGAVHAQGGGKLTVQIEPGFGDGAYVASLYPVGYSGVSVPWQSTEHTWTTDADGFCKEVTIEDSGTDWYADVFNIFDDADAPPGGGTINFTLPPGQTTASGTAHVSGGSNTNVPNYTLGWTLTKTCLKGGTDC